MLKKMLITLSMMTTPVLRELFFGLVSDHHKPFSSFEDILHTGLEVLFMALIGFGLLFILTRLEKTRESKELLDRLVDEKTKEVTLTQKTSIEALATLAEYHDSETGLHLKRIQSFVELISLDLLANSDYSNYLVIRPKYVKDIVMASLLHDIGKVAIPSEILLKPSKLTAKEFEVMKSHTTIAGEMLKKANKIFLDNFSRDSYLALARDIAFYHHEKWDGTGYPKGLKAEEIPLSARIVALCDVYDAVTVERVYKKAWSHEEATKMIIENEGTHFDPIIVKSFLNIEKEFDHIRIEMQD